MDKDKAVEYIDRCRNYDGGFGSSVGAESHSAQGTLSSTHLRSCLSMVLSTNPQFLCAWLLLLFWTD